MTNTLDQERISMSPKVITQHDAPRVTMLGDEVSFILSGDDTGGAVCIGQQRSKPSSGIPLHVHSREDEIFYVFAGEIEFQLGDQIVRAKSGATVFAPRNIPHSFRVVGTEEAHFQVTAVPAGIEKMFAELTKL